MSVRIDHRRSLVVQPLVAPSAPVDTYVRFGASTETSAAWDGEAPIVLSVDVEDYYQVAAFSRQVRRADWEWYPPRIERNVERLLELFGQWKVRATFFVLGWEARQRPQLVRAIAEHGHEVACHSMWHREIYSLSPQEFLADTREAKATIEDAIGREVVGYRAPSFSLRLDSLWALPLLVQLGFRYDSSIFPVRHPNYGIPGAAPAPSRLGFAGQTLWELPPATAAVGRHRIAVAGGAYLRHLPFPLLRWGIRRLTRVERQPAMLYLHPWEIDPWQPRLRASWLTRLRHYGGLAQTETRLEQLVAGRFVLTAGQLIERLERRLEPAMRCERNSSVADMQGAVG